MKKVIVFFLAFIFYKIAVAQCPELPLMFTDSKASKKQIKKFTTLLGSKNRKLIKQGYQPERSYLISRAAMNDFINIIKPDTPAIKLINVFFARYSTYSGDPLFSFNIDPNKMILLFRLAFVKNGIMHYDYYYLSEKANPAILIDSKIAKIWRENFVKHAEPRLSRRIDANKDENFYHDEFLSDTRSINYGSRAFLEAFNNEVNYLENTPDNNIDVVDFKISLASYTRIGNGYVNKNGKKEYQYKKRLLIFFDYISKNGNQFTTVDEESFQNFECRLDASIRACHETPQGTRRQKIIRLMTLRKQNQMDFNKTTEWDNGQLCPTFCPDDDQ